VAGVSLLGRYLLALLATVKRDARIYATYRFRLASQLLGTLLTLTIFFFVAKLVRHDAVGDHASYYEFVVVGLLTMTILQEAMMLSQLVRMELFAGTFERVLVSPLGPVAGAIAMALFPVAFAVLFSGVMLALAAGVYGVPVNLAGVPLALVVAALGALAFAAIAVLFVAALIAFKSSIGATWALAGLGLTAGVYFPTRLFPGWIRWISQVQPLTPTVDLLRHLLLRAPSAQPVSLELVKLAGFAIVLMPLAATLLRGAVALSQRHGTIIEY